MFLFVQEMYHPSLCYRWSTRRSKDGIGRNCELFEKHKKGFEPETEYYKDGELTRFPKYSAATIKKVLRL